MNDRTCSVADCVRPYYGKGLCSSHYQRNKKHGNPLVGGPLPEYNPPDCVADDCDTPVHSDSLCPKHYALQRRHGHHSIRTRMGHGEAVKFVRSLVADINNISPNQCVHWPTPTERRPEVSVPGMGRMTAARYALMLKDGPPPFDNAECCHAPEVCHNPLCVNPHHLRWGTSSDNTADMWRDDTMGYGETAVAAKITEAQATEIIRLRALGVPVKQLAVQFGLKRDGIFAIVRGRSWKHLDRAALIAAGVGVTQEVQKRNGAPLKAQVIA